jgi:hypothetical protein
VTGSLLVEEADAPRLAQLLRSDWEEELARNGLTHVAPRLGAADANGVTCPACGTTAPLDDGACSDCGLMLEQS